MVDVKINSAAFKQGIRPGMKIKTVDGAMAEVIEDVMGLPISELNHKTENYGLNIALGASVIKVELCSFKSIINSSSLP